MGPDHHGVVLGPYVWKPDPQGTYAPMPARAARTSLPTGEEVRCRHVPLGKQPLKPAPPRARWQLAFYGKLAQLPH
jgi:hypothetical protein